MSAIPRNIAAGRRRWKLADVQHIRNQKVFAARVAQGLLHVVERCCDLASQLPGVEFRRVQNVIAAALDHRQGIWIGFPAVGMEICRYLIFMLGMVYPSILVDFSSSAPPTA